MDKFTYDHFLQEKIKEEHAYTHLLEQQIASQKDKIAKLLKDISSLRKTQNDLKFRNRQMQQKMSSLQQQLRMAKQLRNYRAKQATEKRIKQQKVPEVDPKDIFKMYLNNTFPKYKSTIKKLMTVFYVMQDHQQMQPQAKIRFYQSIFEGFVKRILDWIFPKPSEEEKSKKIAQNLIKEWKQKQKLDKNQTDKTNIILIKEAEYINRIEKLQSQIMMLKTSKNMVQNRLKTFQRSLQIKGGEFVVHLKKMLSNDADLSPEEKQKIEEIILIFSQASQNTSTKKEEKEPKEEFISQMSAINLVEKTQTSKRKAAPVLKKNIYGFYQQPQFPGSYNIATTTKHVNNNKQTQTLSQDLCILTLHPVIMVTLIDGNIKPQRTRQSSQFFVKIKINQDNFIESSVKEGLQLFWNEPYLLKDYDFPFINVNLMHKSKGLRDYAIGGGKFSASSQQQKIVNIRKDKQFQGRVRFSLSYPKGNIYQFKITSIRIQIPGDQVILKEQANIKFPYNSLVFTQFILPEKINYLERSIIILQNTEENMSASLLKMEKKGQVSLKEFVGKQGNKQVIVDLQEGWRVIIQGQIYLLICEDQQPQRISQQLLQESKGKYFSVRAPPPIITVSYGPIILHSNIKFPLVYLLNDSNKLSIVKELPSRQISQEIVEPIVNKDIELKISEFIKAPTKIYKFFIQTLQGEKVVLKHQSHLFERLLKQIHLQISYKEEQIQQMNYGRKGKGNKQKLFKEFTIQSKELILNHYKIFSKHFKKIGFVKFKIGYTIVDNQLLTENASTSLKDSRKIQAIKQGTYFISVQLSSAHLNTKSSGSSYKCIINSQSSKLKKGNHVQWAETFIISYQLKSKLQVEVKYEIWEESTFGNNKIYEGLFVINEDALRLGAIIINLNQSKEDCLHLQNICIPTQMLRLNIDSIEAQIKQQSDWIGKIDPYVILQSKNRELLKTPYLDNIGSHPVWKNVNKEIIISNSNKDDDQLINCKLYDYDMIGKDDHLGDVEITTKLNSQLIVSSKSQIIFGNLIKDKIICGSLRLKGYFERFKQQAIRLSEKTQKLNKNELAYRLSIYQLWINNWKQYKDDKGVLIIKNAEQILLKKQFSFNLESLNNFGFNYWIVGSQSLSIQLKRQYKHFFKSVTQTLGSFAISIKGAELATNKQDILNDAMQKIGKCLWFCQLQDKVKYAFVRSATYCKQMIVVKSDLQDEISISYNNQPKSKIIFYCKNLRFVLRTNSRQKILRYKQVQQDLYALYLQADIHENVISYVSLVKDNMVSSRFEEWSEKLKAQPNQQYKKLQFIHWEPYRYQQSSAYEYSLSCLQGNKVTLKQQLNTLYNDYLIVMPYENPTIFQSKNKPTSIQIANCRTKQLQATISIKGDEQRVFVPNKGALYFKLSDYNSKSIMQIKFRYIFIRIRDLQKFINHQHVMLLLKSSFSISSFTCKHIGNTNCFLLQDVNFLLAEPTNSANIFMEAEIQGGETNQSRSLMKFKFGFRLQPNKQQYRIVNNEQYIIQTQFSCRLIQRNYQAPPKQDNIIYGMSFISFNHVQLEVNDDISNRRIYVQIQLSNQYQKIYLQRLKDTNICRVQFDSIFFIQKQCAANLTIIEEGVLSNNVLGNAALTFASSLITKQTVSVHCEVKRKNTIVGRMNVKYTNLQQTHFIDINFFNHISKDTNMQMIAELKEFGPNKQKYQKLGLTSRGNISRLESQDSFILTKDPREYEITVSEKNANKLLGQFKLCHEINSMNKTTVLQPLRTSSNVLNGVLIIEYEKKQSSLLTFNQNKGEQIFLVSLQISNLTLKKHNNRLKDYFSIRLKTPLRQNKTKPISMNKSSGETVAMFIAYNNQPCQISLMDKEDVVGTCNVYLPYKFNRQVVCLLQKDGKTAGIFTLKPNFLLNTSSYQRMREISSIEANDLINTQYFAKMNPFIQLCLNNSTYVTDLGLGKQKIFWKVNLITSQDIKFIVKDKDMFFDDLVGSASIPELTSKQTQQQIFQLNLSPQEGEDQDKRRGTLKVCTSAIECNIIEKDKEQLPIQFNSYLLQLGGLINSSLLSQADSMEVVLVLNKDEKVILLRQFYKQDLYYYLSNKDVQIQFDTYFVNNHELQIIVCFKKNNSVILEQKILKNDTKVEPFTIHSLIPIAREFYYLQEVHLWVYQKIPQHLQVLLNSTQQSHPLNIYSRSKYLLTLKPSQLSSQIHSNTLLTLIIKEDSKAIYQLSFSLNFQSSLKNQYVISGNIFDMKKTIIGQYYASVGKFKSNGQKAQRKINIGRSKRKWLNIGICQARLTKDIQFLSKMDPYCKFGFLDEKQSWKKTSVQDNIGMHPIWNQWFFIQIQKEDKQIGFMVMDEELTVDRIIGEGKISVKSLLQAQNSVVNVDLLYSKNQSSGKLQIQAKTTNKYIIFRDMISFSQDPFYIMRQQSNEGDKIQLTIAYPIDEEKPLQIKHKDTKLNYTLQQLKQKLRLGIYFTQSNASLRFDLYQ